MDPQPEQRWECATCSKTFKTKSYLTAHMVTHDPDAKVTCEECGKTFKNRRVLSNHKWYIHTNRNRPRCDTCHRVFATPSILQRHIDITHLTEEGPPFPCKFRDCEETYLHEDDLLDHVKTEHVKNPVRFPCELCRKKFKTRVQLEAHIPTHTRTKKKEYKCATCWRSFARRENMKSHEVTHLAQYARAVCQCRICPQTFSNRSALKRHVRAVHENQRKFLCTFCGKRFARSADWKRHVGAVHATNKEPIFACPGCEYKSHSEVNLAQHMRRHNDPRHECYFCGKEFVTFWELVKHFRVHTLERKI